MWCGALPSPGCLHGAEARNSTQFEAARAFLRTCRKKDIEAIRAAIDPKTRDAMMQMFSGPDKEAPDVVLPNGRVYPRLHLHENHRSRGFGQARFQ